MSFQAPFSITDMRRLQMADAQNQQAQQQAMMEGVQQGIGSLLGAFVENEAMTAKGKAVGNFLKMHGEQLGFEPTYLENLLKKKPREIAMESEALGLTNMGNRLMGLNYLNTQMAPRAVPAQAGYGTSGGSGAGGGGGDVLTF